MGQFTHTQKVGHSRWNSLLVLSWHLKLNIFVILCGCLSVGLSSVVCLSASVFWLSVSKYSGTQGEELFDAICSKHLTCFGEANDTLGIASLKREQVTQRLISTENLHL